MGLVNVPMTTPEAIVTVGASSIAAEVAWVMIEDTKSALESDKKEYGAIAMVESQIVSSRPMEMMSVRCLWNMLRWSSSYTVPKVNAR